MCATKVLPDRWQSPRRQVLHPSLLPLSHLRPLSLLYPPRCPSSPKMASPSGTNQTRKATWALFSHPGSPGLPNGLREGHSRTWSQSASCRWSGALGHALGFGCPGHLPQNTCTLSTRLFPGRNQRFPEDGTLNGVKTCYYPSCSHGNWNGQEPEHVPWAARALTLSNGENQVSFFPKILVQLWRPEEAMPEGSEPSPLNSWLDSFLRRK